MMSENQKRLVLDLAAAVAEEQRIVEEHAARKRDLRERQVALGDQLRQTGIKLTNAAVLVAKTHGEIPTPQYRKRFSQRMALRKIRISR